MKAKYSIFGSIVLCTFLAVEAQATTLDDIGFTDLSLELGAALPDGASIAVTQVEAPNPTACMPDTSRTEFSHITFIDNTQISCTGISAHATGVAKILYSSLISSSTAIGTVDLFEAVNWLGNGFLNTGVPGPITNSIDISTTRLANHSWTGNFFPDTNWAPEILRRVDFLVEVDEFIQVVGVSTNTIVSETPSNSFNAIVAGLSAGTGITGTAALDTTYVSARAKPDIVAPEANGSSSAPRVSSAAVLLMDYAHINPLLSNGSTTNRNSDIIYNAERSETIKALLMAGADRATVGNTNAVDITDYRAVGKQTSNGLDTRFGAGQLNIYNSYHLLAAGEQDSAEDGGSTFANVGFDYDPSFGGASGNATATYSFTTSAISGHKLKAALVWNLDVLTKSTDNFYDLDLQLIDVTAGGGIVVSSTSTIDNTENIWWDLASNNNYQLKVIQGNGQSAFEWDYALAWQIVVPGVTVVESAGSTATTEDGTTDTFTVVLDSPPAGDVTINLVSSEPSEGTLSPSSLTFTSANWSALQTVTVTGVNDALDDGDINYNISFSVSSVADANYNGMAVASIAASNTDDDATFSFIDQTNVAFDTLFTSNNVVISGLLSSINISINAGEYSINGGAYTSTAGTINNADDVTVRVTSSGIGSTPVNAVLTIGDVSDTFTVTTELDTDGDGVGNSIDTDDDNDGLIDTDELVLGTDPLFIDTDNDGYTDSEEVSAGSDPLNISSIPIFPDGDINDDGLIDMGDIILARQIIMGNVELTSTSLAHGDVAPLVNGIPSPDGLFTLGDFLVIQRKIMGEITF
ncbi:MAG: dockerin type I repeat-containing protein [Gammaproteobacteria bacterium]|nr:dockerin type I repeat-containing protein [Gammaproteobacteria bacterium]MCK5262177.1 dockerin type I repeat-containing protein [Gammaproteobacteria bacterium]